MAGEPRISARVLRNSREAVSAKERVRRCLESGGRITSRDAYEQLGTMRLASRICELRAEGVPIKTKRRRELNRLGKPVFVAEYYIESDGGKE